MFTGLIQAVGRLTQREVRGGDQRLRFGWGTLPAHDIELGESIAVSGCCLTVVAWDAHGFDADVSNETLALTTLGGLPIGAAVNLERSLLPTTLIGGHLVSGHVDGVGEVEKFERVGESHELVVKAPKNLAKYIARKGSITVNGVSLTVNRVDKTDFSINLIPHTVAVTTLKHLKTGSQVNLEIDLVARYIERMMTA